MGFSVDVPAHVSFQYHAAGSDKRSDVRGRMKEAFLAVGYPAIQASFCTNVCILCLLLVPLYMAKQHSELDIKCLGFRASHVPVYYTDAAPQSYSPPKHVRVVGFAQ